MIFIIGEEHTKLQTGRKKKKGETKSCQYIKGSIQSRRWLTMQW